MNAREIMSKDCATISPDSTLRAAARMMRDDDIGAIPVVEVDGGRRVMGMITDRDIVCRGLADGCSPETRVSELMSRDIVECGPEDDIDAICRHMADKQVRRVLVTEDGQLCGVIAQADLARHLDPRRAGELLDRISSPSGQPRA